MICLEIYNLFAIRGDKRTRSMNVYRVIVGRPWKMARFYGEAFETCKKKNARNSSNMNTRKAGFRGNGKEPRASDFLKMRAPI